MKADNLREVLKRGEAKGFNPLIHSITNFVSVNDVAQGILLYGGKPIMAVYREEVCEIAREADCILLNLGTIDKERIDSCRIISKVAKKKGIPVVLDPIGAHVSKVRRKLALEIINEGVSVIKGNLSEIKGLLGLNSEYSGIDSLERIGITDKVKEEIRKFSIENDTVILVTGENDYITNGREDFIILNGIKELSLVTGTGCILGGLIATDISKRDKKNYIYGVLKSILTINISAEMVEEKLNNGIISFKHALMDKISLIDIEELVKGGKVNYERLK